MSPVFVGNDVVDLTNPRTEGRATDDRFVGRVFDPEEQDSIRAAGSSDLELWSRWAAKEAGFKSISKALGGVPPHFVHRAFKVAWSATNSHDAPPAEPCEVLAREGTVEYLDRQARVSVAWRDGAVHAVAYVSENGESEAVSIRTRVARTETPGSPWAGSLEELRRSLSGREAEAVHSRESAAVRIGAREELARLLGVPESRLEIVCAPGPSGRRPPCVLLDGLETTTDLSLSHDGRWIAWAIWVAE